jgi:hypothetical protein
MNQFIYAYDKITKEKLENNGYEFMNEINYKGKKAYLFINNGNKMNFTNDNLEFSNRLYC